jgi:formamidopyrimidine-DNA glycosylase
MPELPEVETVVRLINKSIKSKTISKLTIINKKLRWPIDASLSTYAKGQDILEIYRRGKHIIFKLKNGYILIHLGMTGIVRFFKKSSLKKIDKHDHYEIELKNESVLRYNDIRKFGSIHWAENINDHFLIKNLGIEPLSKELNINYLNKVIKNRSVSIKNLIMNQNIIVGIGNIYACESLYMSGIKPQRKSSLISKQELKKLISSIKLILKKAINSGGTTLKDFKKLDGTPGYFEQELLIYSRKHCQCGEIVKNIKLGGRSSFYCNRCQK